MSQVASISELTGSAYILRDGKEIALTAETPLYETDILNTADGTIKVLFTDGSNVSIGPNTELAIADYAYTETDESFILDLVEGTMQSISGDIVKRNPDAFKIETPKATIGIRGTTTYHFVGKDGEEEHAIISISDGHTVVITLPNGESVVLTTNLEGLTIDENSSDYDLILISPERLTEIQESFTLNAEDPLAILEELSSIISEISIQIAEENQNVTASARLEAIKEVLNNLVENPSEDQITSTVEEDALYFYDEDDDDAILSLDDDLDDNSLSYDNDDDTNSGIPTAPSKPQVGPPPTTTISLDSSTKGPIYFELENGSTATIGEFLQGGNEFNLQFDPANIIYARSLSTPAGEEVQLIADGFQITHTIYDYEFTWEGNTPQFFTTSSNAYNVLSEVETYTYNGGGTNLDSVTGAGNTYETNFGYIRGTGSGTVTFAAASNLYNVGDGTYNIINGITPEANFTGFSSVEATVAGVESASGFVDIVIDPNQTQTFTSNSITFKNFDNVTAETVSTTTNSMKHSITSNGVFNAQNADYNYTNFNVSGTNNTLTLGNNTASSLSASNVISYSNRTYSGFNTLDGDTSGTITVNGLDVTYNGVIGTAGTIDIIDFAGITANGGSDTLTGITNYNLQNTAFKGFETVTGDTSGTLTLTAGADDYADYAKYTGFKIVDASTGVDSIKASAAIIINSATEFVSNILTYQNFELIDANGLGVDFSNNVSTWIGGNSYTMQNAAQTVSFTNVGIASNTNITSATLNANAKYNINTTSLTDGFSSISSANLTQVTGNGTNDTLTIDGLVDATIASTDGFIHGGIDFSNFSVVDGGDTTDDDKLKANNDVTYTGNKITVQNNNSEFINFESINVSTNNLTTSSAITADANAKTAEDANVNFINFAKITANSASDVLENTGSYTVGTNTINGVTYNGFETIKAGVGAADKLTLAGSLEYDDINKGYSDGTTLFQEFEQFETTGINATITLSAENDDTVDVTASTYINFAIIDAGSKTDNTDRDTLNMQGKDFSVSGTDYLIEGILYKNFENFMNQTGNNLGQAVTSSIVLSSDNLSIDGTLASAVIVNNTYAAVPGATATLDTEIILDDATNQQFTATANTFTLTFKNFDTVTSSNNGTLTLKTGDDVYTVGSAFEGTTYTGFGTIDGGAHGAGGDTLKGLTNLTYNSSNIYLINGTNYKNFEKFEGDGTGTLSFSDTDDDTFTVATSPFTGFKVVDAGEEDFANPRNDNDTIIDTLLFGANTDGIVIKYNNYDDYFDSVDAIPNSIELGGTSYKNFDSIDLGGNDVTASTNNDNNGNTTLVYIMDDGSVRLPSIIGSSDNTTINNFGDVTFIKASGGVDENDITFALDIDESIASATVTSSANNTINVAFTENGKDYNHTFKNVDIINGDLTPNFSGSVSSSMNLTGTAAGETFTDFYTIGNNGGAYVTYNNVTFQRVGTIDAGGGEDTLIFDSREYAQALQVGGSNTITGLFYYGDELRAANSLKNFEKVYASVDNKPASLYTYNNFILYNDGTNDYLQMDLTGPDEAVKTYAKFYDFHNVYGRTSATTVLQNDLEINEHYAASVNVLTPTQQGGVDATPTSQAEIDGTLYLDFKEITGNALSTLTFSTGNDTYNASTGTITQLNDTLLNDPTKTYTAYKGFGIVDAGAGTDTLEFDVLTDYSITAEGYIEANGIIYKNFEGSPTNGNLVLSNPTSVSGDTTLNVATLSSGNIPSADLNAKTLAINSAGTGKFTFIEDPNTNTNILVALSAVNSFTVLNGNTDLSNITFNDFTHIIANFDDTNNDQLDLRIDIQNATYNHETGKINNTVKVEGFEQIQGNGRTATNFNNIELFASDAFSVTGLVDGTNFAGFANVSGTGAVTTTGLAGAGNKLTVTANEASFVVGDTNNANQATYSGFTSMTSSNEFDILHLTHSLYDNITYTVGEKFNNSAIFYDFKTIDAGNQGAAGDRDTVLNLNGEVTFDPTTPSNFIVDGVTYKNFEIAESNGGNNDTVKLDAVTNYTYVINSDGTQDTSDDIHGVKVNGVTFMGFTADGGTIADYEYTSSKAYFLNGSLDGVGTNITNATISNTGQGELITDKSFTITYDGNITTANSNNTFIRYTDNDNPGFRSVRAAGDDVVFTMNNPQTIALIAKNGWVSYNKLTIYDVKNVQTTNNSDELWLDDYNIDVTYTVTKAEGNTVYGTSNVDSHTITYSNFGEVWAEATSNDTLDVSGQAISIFADEYTSDFITIGTSDFYRFDIISSSGNNPIEITNITLDTNGDAAFKVAAGDSIEYLGTEYSYDSHGSTVTLGGGVEFTFLT